MEEKKQHKDLIEFETKYNERINKLLSDELETNIVFLNGDFGWGKTTFVKENLGVPDNLRYSPWLNKSENYLDDIYYYVTKCDKGNLSSKVLFISSIIAIITLIFSSVMSILIDIFNSGSIECKIIEDKIICESSNSLHILLIGLLAIMIIVGILLRKFVYKSPVPFINIYKKESSKYYENKIIEKILEKVNKVFVIEDIDRVDDIEDILVIANKISDYIKEKRIKKYILITGDYARTVRRIDNLNNYSNQNFNLENERSRGTFVLERIISLRIDFSPMRERINTLLSEYDLSANLKQIEFDEIIAFVKSKYLSIRFFDKFLKAYDKEIKDGCSLFHLLIKYYQEEKYFNIETELLENSIYNTSNFPVCLNDIEMLLQKGIVKINNKIEYHELKENQNPNKNHEVIANAFYNLIFYKDVKSLGIFKDYYNNNVFPALQEEIFDASRNNNYVNIGSRLKHNLKNDLDSFLISNNNCEIGGNILNNKRCYFSSSNSINNFDYYRINSVRGELVKTVKDDEFIYAYIACFFRKNKNEFEKNYPKLTEKVNEINTV